MPKTIDNDIVGTDMTFGFHTAVQIATDAIDRLHTTAESHDRVMVVEVMGRHAGWIATYAGIAGGATVILIPEQPFDIDEVCAHPAPAPRARPLRLDRRRRRGRRAEGQARCRRRRARSYDQFGHVRLGGIADTIAHAIEDRTGFETRVVMLGHVQRGGTPTAFDRVLSTRFGVAAIDAVHDGAWGQMVVLRGDRDRAGAAATTPSARPGPSTCTCTTTSPRSSSAERPVAGERRSALSWSRPAAGVRPGRDVAAVRRSAPSWCSSSRPVGGSASGNGGCVDWRRSSAARRRS